MQFSVGDAHRVDGAGGASHTAGDAGALKGGAGSGGGHKELSVFIQRNFAICADIAKQSCRFFTAQP